MISREVLRLLGFRRCDQQEVNGWPTETWYHADEVWVIYDFDKTVCNAHYAPRAYSILDADKHTDEELFAMWIEQHDTQLMERARVVF